MAAEKKPFSWKKLKNQFLDLVTNPFNMIVFISLILLIFLIAIPLIRMLRTTFILAAGELRRVQKTTPNAQVGDLVRIVQMKNGPQYNGKDGTVTKIDRVGFLHGTWGEMPICPSNDEYETILPADINGPIEHLMKK